jgi:hypothetical protein
MRKMIGAVKSHVFHPEMEGDELSSVQTQWGDGMAERAAAGIVQNVGLVGIMQSERAWVAFVLPQECRERMIEATLSSVREKGLQLCRMIMELPLGPKAGKSELAESLFPGTVSHIHRRPKQNRPQRTEPKARQRVPGRSFRGCLSQR